ncbi:MAG: hypothetical protein GYB67_19045 [Chloroflexi bacterium]|nr:hypothetical protein [Chloroflexota bacterium]
MITLLCFALIALTAAQPTPPIIDVEQPLQLAFDGAPLDLPFQPTDSAPLTIAARALSGDLDPTLEILDAANRRIAFNDDHGTARADLAPSDALLHNLQFSADAPVMVRVNTFSGTGSGSIEVSITPTAALTPVPIPADALIVSGSVAPNAIFRYALIGEAAAALTISARATDGRFDPILTLLDTAGSVIAANDDHRSADPTLARRDAQIVLATMPDAGCCIIEVAGFVGMGGAFELVIARTPVGARPG